MLLECTNQGGPLLHQETRQIRSGCWPSLAGKRLNPLTAFEGTKWKLGWGEDHFKRILAGERKQVDPNEGCFSTNAVGPMSVQKQVPRIRVGLKFAIATDSNGVCLIAFCPKSYPLFPAFSFLGRGSSCSFCFFLSCRGISCCFCFFLSSEPSPAAVAFSPFSPLEPPCFCTISRVSCLFSPWPLSHVPLERGVSSFHPGPARSSCADASSVDSAALRS